MRLGIFLLIAASVMAAEKKVVVPIPRGPGAADGSGYVVPLNNGQVLRGAKLRNVGPDLAEFEVNGRRVEVKQSEIADPNLQAWVRQSLKDKPATAGEYRWPSQKAFATRLKKIGTARKQVPGSATKPGSDPREETARLFREDILRTAYIFKVDRELKSEEIDWPKSGWPYVRLRGILNLSQENKPEPVEVSYEFVFEARSDGTMGVIGAKIGEHMAIGHMDF